MSAVSLIGRIQSTLFGFFAGLMNGLIALGGGIFLTPMLVMHRGAAPEVAVGTSLCAVIILSACSLVLHTSVSGLILGWEAILITVVSGVAGSVIGGRILAGISPRAMMLTFSVFVLLVSGRLIAQGLGYVLPVAESSAGAPVWAYMALGCFSGVLSGLFGVGGGALVLLGLAAFFGTPVQEGLPIAFALNITNALAGAWRHARAGRVLWREVRILIPSAVVGIFCGTAAALSLPPDALRIFFGCFFLFMGTRIARQALRSTASRR